MIILSIPDFEVNTDILNPVDVFRKWYKLSFRSKRDRLNHAIFLSRWARGDNIFTFLYKFIGIISYKQLAQLLETYLNLLLPFKRNRIRFGAA